jgi:two-component sensor histidine kinase
MGGSLRSRLGRALLVALIPVLLLGLIGAVFNYGDEVNDRREVLTATALRSASEVRARTESGSLILSVLAADTVASDCVATLRNARRRLTGYRNLIRLDAEGRVACAAAPVTEAFTTGAQAWMEQLRAGAPLLVFDAMNAGPPSLIAASRVETAAGRFDGALVSVIDPASLSPLLQQPGLPAGTQVAVADRSGRLLTPANPAAFGDALRGGPTREGDVRLFRAELPSGARDVAIAPLLGDDVFLLLSAPAPGPLSWARLNPLVSVGVPMLAFLAAFLAVYMAADRMVIRWLAYLERVAAVYARGRFGVRPSVSAEAPSEVRSLAATLGEMADTIVARDASLRESLAQKDALLREIHHRVKNNLQVITSLLNLQQRSLADPAGRAVLADTRQRISALALIYRALYQSEDLRRVDVRSFLEELIGQLINGEGPREEPVRAEVHADDLMMDPDKLAPFALFTVEAVTNAQKHAFSERGGSITVRFEVRGAEARLEVQDDGIGADAGTMTGGVGRTLMNAFARQLRGRAELETPEGGGVVARLIFPTPEVALSAP